MAWTKEKTPQPVQIRQMQVHDFYDLICIFAAGGLLGTLYETLLVLVLRGVLEDRSGSILTPFNYVYGVGAAAIYLSVYRLKRPAPVFLLGAVLGGAVEYGLSLFQEFVLGSRSWDYSSCFLNIHGRTTVPYMLVWGVLCCFAMWLVFPVLLRIAHQIPEAVRKRAAAVLFAVILLDACVSLLAMIRYSQRANGLFFDNVFANLVDKLFPDPFMRWHFPNLVLY